MKNSEISLHWINGVARDIHANACDKGFYEDSPKGYPARRANEGYIIRRINLINSEVAEAYEAIRAGKVIATAHPTATKDSPDFAAQYVELVKGTAEEELADTFIRILDFVASLGEVVSSFEFSKNPPKPVVTIDHAFYQLTRTILDLAQLNTSEITVAKALHICISIATYLEINLARAVVEKMAYNKTRPYKHGKKF